MSAVLEYLPRGNTLSDEEWHRRHKFLQWILAGHIPALFAFGVLRGYAVADVAETLALPLAVLIVGHLLRSRRIAAGFITLGLVYCSAALVGFSDGAIEAHFHFFIMIGFIALYQDWVPFLLNIGFTVLSHGIGSSLVPDLMFSHTSAQEHPWEWSLIHGVAVLAACVGVVVFWKSTEDEQGRSLTLTKELADAEIGRRRFTSDLLVNLARRNQNLLYRQLDLLNELEDKERDPDALANLFRLDHLATRIRRNAESLLVLSGEESPRTWREPVQLGDVVRAAIAEIEDLDRVDDAIDETLAVSGRTVADLTHLFAELLENAVRFSPPGVTVVVRSRPVPSSPGIHLVTIEDWGGGMTPQELAEANDILRAPREVDLSVSQRLGLHVVARLAQRYGITVELTPTPGGGVTAVAVLPPVVFERSPELVGARGPALNGYGFGGSPAGGFAAPGLGTPPAVRGGGARPAGLPAGAPAGPVNGAAAAVRTAPVPAPPRAPAEPVGASADAPAGVAGNGGRPVDGRLVDGRPVDERPGGATRAGDVTNGPAGIAAPGPDGQVADAPARPAPPASARPAPPAPARPAPPAPPAPARPAPPASARPAPPAAAVPTPPAPVRAAPPVPAGDAPRFSLPRRGPGESLASTPLGRSTPPEGTTGVDRRSTADRTNGPAADRTNGSAGDRTNGVNGSGSDGADRAPGAGDRGPADRGPADRAGLSRAGFAATAAGGDGAIQPGYSGPRPFGELSDGSENWSSWWTGAAPVDSTEPTPDPDPTPQRPEPDDTNGSDPMPLPEPRPPADDGPQLRRRVPQAHLAAGLRREAEQPPAEETPGVRDPMAARNALSRFQAAQRAARDQVEGDHPEGPSR